MSTNETTVTAMGSGPDIGLPPAALARHADIERRRELARALHAPPQRARRITERLEAMREEIARYRAQAIALHAKLVALEAAGNDNVAALRRALIESSVKIEGGARGLVDSQIPRWPRGTEALDEWMEQQVTLRR
jgi:hypothetical protein